MDTTGGLVADAVQAGGRFARQLNQVDTPAPDGLRPALERSTTPAGNLLSIDWAVERSIHVIEKDWRAFESAAICTPFQSFDWMRAIYRSRSSQDQTFFVLGRRAGELVLILPVSVETGPFGRTLRWFGDQRSDYNMPLASRELFATLSERDVTRIFAEVRPLVGYPTAAMLRRQPEHVDGLRNPFAAWCATTEPTSAYSLQLFQPWESFYDALYSSGMRKRYRERQRRLDRLDGYECCEITGVDEIVRHLGILLDWKALQIGQRGGQNRLARAADRTFLFDFAASANGRARLFAMSVEGRPIAALFAVDAPRNLLIYQTAYEAGAHDKQSPGRLLVNHVMRTAIEEGKLVLDFTVGDEQYKREICDVRLGLTTSLKAFAPSGLPVVWKERLILAAKRAIKANPRVFAAVLALHSRLRSASAREA